MFDCYKNNDNNGKHIIIILWIVSPETYSDFIKYLYKTIFL